MKTKIYSWVLILTFSMLTIFALLCYGIAVANASNENSDVTMQVVDLNQSNDLPEGVKIWNGNVEAQSPDDYEIASENRILLKKDGLRIQGTSNEPVNAGILVTKEFTVKDVTLDNLNLYYTENHNTILLYCVAATDQEENATAFTLNIKGECYIYQVNEDLNNHAIYFENGDLYSNVRINADEDSYLECYSYGSDTIFMQRNPLVFSGELETVIYSEQDGGDAIDWDVEDSNNNNLTLTDDVIIGVGNTNTKNETAINVCNLNVLDNSNLIAICNNYSTKDMGAINVQGKFFVDTTGDVLLDAYNAKSWQAVICKNNMEIKKCRSFQAYAQDYSAVEVRGTLTIDEDAIENVYFSGGFLPVDGRAQRGAFTVEHPDRLIIPGSYLMYGSDQREAELEEITQRAVVTFSSGSDEFDVYTPVIPDWIGLSAPKYAHSVVFREGKELVFVPGVKPAYDHGGYRDCYKIKDENVYFEDYEQKIPIENIMEWRSKDGKGFLRSLSDDFDAYRETVLDQCDLMHVRGDRPEVTQLINEAELEIDGYIYDESISLLNNKVELDNIYKQLDADIDSLDLPLPEPWTPPSPENPSSDGGNGAQTGDGFPLWASILLMLVIVGTAIVVWRKREFIKSNLVVNRHSSAITKNGFMAILFLAIVIPMLFIFGVVAAFANANIGNAPSSVGTNNFIFANQIFKQYSDEPYPGILVTKNSQPATLDVDYAVDISNKSIEIKNSGLTLTGGTGKNPVEVSVFTDQSVRDLTIDDLHIYSQNDYTTHKIGNTMYIDWDWKTGEERSFTLNVKGDCDISQTGNNGGCAINIVNEQGHGCNIHGDKGSTLYCYAKFYEAIFNHTGPLQISGDLEAYIEADRDNCIGWREDAHNTNLLGLTDNVSVTCYASASHNYSAIEAGSFAVLHNASLYVLNNNGQAKNVATINVKHFFGIDTTGDVIVGNENEKSWQAIKCETLSILNCAQFLAFSSDYCAIECTNSITIETPNVIICGEFNREQTDNRARRGAITISDPNKIYISPDILAFGSVEAYNIKDTNNLAFMLRTVGEDVSKDETLYTPVVCDGNFATIAKTITFARVAHNLELVPASAPTYFNPGYRECYQCKLCGYYFEEEASEHQITNIEAWRSVGSNGYIAPLSENFEPYRARMVDACNNMFVKGDVSEIRSLVEDAQVQIQNYVYNESMSMPANKAALVNIYYQLLDAVNNVQL